MNKIIITGNITKDIELKYTKTDKEYTRFSLAVKRDMKNQLGEYETDFINCIAYSNSAKYLSEYVQKGDKIGIEGRLQVSVYEKDGKKMYSSDIVVDKIEIMQRKTTLEPKKEETKEKIKQEKDPFEEFAEETENLELPF